MRARFVLIILILLGLAGCGGSDEPAPTPAPATPAKVVGYFPGWAVYTRDVQIKELAADKLTHLVYAFGKIADGRCAPADAWADYQKPIAGPDSVDGAADGTGDALRGNFGQLR